MDGSGQKTTILTVGAIGEKGDIWLTVCAHIGSSPKQPLGSL